MSWLTPKSRMAAPRQNTPMAWVPNMGMKSPYESFDPSIWSNTSAFDWQKLNQEIGDASMGTFVPPVAGGSNIPGVTPPTNGMSPANGWGWNPESFATGMYGLQTLGGLYLGLGQYDLAKQSLAMEKDFGNQNLLNSIAAYNFNLDHLAKMRAPAGTDPAVIQSYIDQNKLSRTA